MKKGSKVKVVKEQINRHQWMIENNIYWGLTSKDGEFHMSSLKVGNIYEVSKTRGVKGPSKGYIEILKEDGTKAIVLKEDVSEVVDD